MTLKHPFDPLVDERSRVLMLGSFPSIRSFANDFYYGNKQNQFWRILGEVFNVHLDTIASRKELIGEKGIALWDVVRSCTRTNSLDSNLKVVEVNDIPGLLEKYPKIHTLFFTGKKAYELYRKNFRPLSVATVVLPSTSPANTRVKYYDKLAIYRKELLQALLSTPEHS